MKKRSKILIGIFLLILSVGCGVVGTLAYLHTITETKTNTFSSNKNINIALRENQWDGYDFTDFTTKNGQGTKNDSMSNDLGYNQAQAYVPGQIIPKNPTVKNTGDKDGVSAYVAIKVEYIDDKGKSVDYDTFRKEYLTDSGIEFDSNWTKMAKQGNADVFIYKKALTTDDASNTSTALFNLIPISESLETGTDGKLPSFAINVTAYAIQTDNVKADDINLQMCNTFNFKKIN